MGPAWHPVDTYTTIESFGRERRQKFSGEGVTRHHTEEEEEEEEESSGEEGGATGWRRAGKNLGGRGTGEHSEGEEEA